jgi:hypothetical protein
MQGSKVSKGARKRGQLSSLLVEAYQNREALEERIAEGRRNRKEAGNKYGAFHSIRVGSVCRLTFRKDFNNYPIMAMWVIVVLLARFPSAWPCAHGFCHHEPCLLFGSLQ